MVRLFTVIASVWLSACSQSEEKDVIMAFDYQYAIKTRDYGFLEKHLNAKNIDSILIEQRTILAYASKNLDLKLIQFALDKGADVNWGSNEYFKNSNPIPSLLMGGRKGEPNSEETEIIKSALIYFIDHGLDSTYKAKEWRYNVLMFALENINDHSFAKMVIDKGINLHEVYPDVGTPLFWTKDSVLRMLLIDKGVDSTFIIRNGKSFRAMLHRKEKNVFGVP
jgi:hypothetical protein